MDNRWSKPHFRFAKKKKVEKRPDFIYKDDLCFFTTPHEVFPAGDKWEYSDAIMRVIWPGEPIVYFKKVQGPDKKTRHCFESLGLKYVFVGSIKEFTKEWVPYKEGWPEEYDFR